MDQLQLNLGKWETPQIPSVQTPSAARINPTPSLSASAQQTNDVASLQPSSPSSPSARNIIEEAVIAALLQIQEFVAKKEKVFDKWQHYRLNVPFSEMASKIDALIRMENDILQFGESSSIPAAMRRKELYLARHREDRFEAIISDKIYSYNSSARYAQEDAYIIIALQSHQMTAQAETNLLRHRFGLIDLGFAREPQTQVTEPTQKYVVQTSSQTDAAETYTSFIDPYETDFCFSDAAETDNDASETYTCLSDAAVDRLIEEIISEPAVDNVASMEKYLAYMDKYC